jgi:hypothetical protein
MSTMLAKLKFVVATRPVRSTTKPTNESRRAKMSASIDEQLKLIQGEIAGKPYTATVTKKDKAGNVKTTPKRLRGWFWKDASGVFCEVKYGPTSLKLGADGKSAFKTASYDELVKTLKLVQTAVTAGELDAQITAAALSRRKK